MEPAPIGESITSDSRRTRNTNTADVEMIADDLEVEFRKLCGNDQLASLQPCEREEASRERCELEELAEVKKAEREEELLRLRRQAEFKMGTVKESAQRSIQKHDSVTRVQGEDDDVRAQDSDQMGSPRYLALPEVRPYSEEDPAYGFDAFLESFVVKYPSDSWAGAERGVLLRSKLTGRARKQYEALSTAIREVAPGELKKLRMKEGQSVADFCVELEQLTRRTHPHMDEAALHAQRAQLLYEHLAHWNDSYHLMEALESESQAYERLKQTAMRIERRDLSLRNSRATSKSERGTGGEERRPKPQRGMGVRKEMEGLTGYGVRSFDHIGRSGLLTAMDDGYDIDREVVEHPMDKSLRVCNASGKVMRFVAIVEVKVRESGEPAQEVVAKMYVTRVMEDVLILGTNVLNALGYTLTKHVRCSDQDNDGTRNRDAISTTGKQARVAYGVPTNLDAWNAAIWVCKVGADADGVVEVPVLNGQEEPAVLRVGEAVGRWEEKEDWIEVNGEEVPSESLTLAPADRSENDRMDTLRELLAQNRRKKVIPMELWNIVKGNQDVFAVDDSELTQHHSLPMKLIREARRQSDNGQDRYGVLTNLDAWDAAIWVCKVGADADGVVEVPVLNGQEEPAVLRVGEAVGRWEEKEDWIEVNGEEVPSESLTLAPADRSENDRMDTLRELLAQNRRKKVIPMELWNIVKGNQDVFAVDDSELTQHHSLPMKLIREARRQSDNGQDRYP
ncbi:unnamed protein product [Heligmosomoides polygyrus]|uniref:Reverse transcriptase domain-containing protein n=1 Tax=Heligmosomoides polygyrus TaxID=6339 RepID=A0A183GB54_HELPZ|nr:unnamed protein product [Heligmosomoides polygyrus]